MHGRVPEASPGRDACMSPPRHPQPPLGLLAPQDHLHLLTLSPSQVHLLYCSHDPAPDPLQQLFSHHQEGLRDGRPRCEHRLSLGLYFLGFPGISLSFTSITQVGSGTHPPGSSPLEWSSLIRTTHSKESITPKQERSEVCGSRAPAAIRPLKHVLVVSG